MRSENQSYNRSLRWVAAFNDTGEDVPPYGLVKLVGRSEKGGTVVKPDEDNCPVFVNGPVAIRDGETGQVTSGGPVVIATDGTVADGEECGAQADSFLAVSGNSGFVVIQGVDGKAFADRSLGSREVGRWAFIGSDDAIGDYWPAKLLDKDGSGGRVYGDSIRVKLINPGGEEFVIGTYWVTQNGPKVTDPPITFTDGVTVEDSDQLTSATAEFTDLLIGATITGTGIPDGTTVLSVESATSLTMSAEATADGTDIEITITPTIEYAVYDSPGTDANDITDCVDEVLGTRQWNILHPWKVGDFVPD